MSQPNTQSEKMDDVVATRLRDYYGESSTWVEPPDPIPEAPLTKNQKAFLVYLYDPPATLPGVEQIKIN